MASAKRTCDQAANRHHHYRPIGNAVALGVPPDQIKPYLQATKERAKAYEAAGYIVINGASIDAAPTDVFVPPLDDLPDAWRQTSSVAGSDIDIGSGEWR